MRRLYRCLEPTGCHLEQTSDDPFIAYHEEAGFARPLFFEIAIQRQSGDFSK